MFKVKKMDQKTRTMAKMCSQNVLHGSNDVMQRSRTGMAGKIKKKMSGVRMMDLPDIVIKRGVQGKTPRGHERGKRGKSMMQFGDSVENTLGKHTMESRRRDPGWAQTDVQVRNYEIHLRDAENPSDRDTISSYNSSNVNNITIKSECGYFSPRRDWEDNQVRRHDARKDAGLNQPSCIEPQ